MFGVLLCREQIVFSVQRKPFEVLRFRIFRFRIVDFFIVVRVCEGNLVGSNANDGAKDFMPGSDDIVSLELEVVVSEVVPGERGGFGAGDVS